jgi:glutamate N-acetyltransferase/amino-acid N-acetyltransferase
MKSYTSEDAYLRDLAARAALPEGFRAATTAIRFLPAERSVGEPLPMNLSLILLDRDTESFAGVFTRNRFPGAPVLIGRERLARPSMRGVLVNTKVSNVCAPQGRRDAEGLLESLGGLLGVPADGFFPASTGIIGWSLPVKEMKAALPVLVKGLQPDTILPIARAIMTTDSFAKVRSVQVGKGTVVGIAKGAGMMEPNMATMLCFICTDVAVERERLKEDLLWCADRSLNRISVDGDQSTSDMAIAFSSGRKPAVGAGELRSALLEVLSGLAADIVRNGEGAGHVVRIRVKGARDEAAAAGIGKAVANSPLVKSAIFGNDPNVGRIVSAIGDHLGNHGIEADTRAVAIRLGGTEIFSRGAFRLDAVKEKALSSYLKEMGYDPKVKGYPQHEGTVDIDIEMGGGSPAVEILGTDLSYEYVRENADYRS